jgi:lipopolysaccharide transport system permease protein
MKLIIERGHVAQNYWRDLWRYRELLYFLAWRDISVRYKQTIIGIVWAILKPALTMLVFVAFRRLLGVERGLVPESILVLSAVLPWQFFASALSESSGSLIGNSNLISKVYFPRLIVPCAAVITSFVDFLITLGLLIGLMLWHRFTPSWHLFALPLFISLAFGLSAGMGLIFAALNVKYRDFRYIVPFIVQFGMFISPIAFSTANVPERWRQLYELNPMVGIIDGFRWAILRGTSPLSPNEVILSVVSTVVFLVIGIWYFRSTERNFADVL